MMLTSIDDYCLDQLLPNACKVVIFLLSYPILYISHLLWWISFPFSFLSLFSSFLLPFLLLPLSLSLSLSFSFSVLFSSSFVFRLSICGFLILFSIMLLSIRQIFHFCFHCTRFRQYVLKICNSNPVFKITLSCWPTLFAYLCRSSFALRTMPPSKGKYFLLWNTKT